MKFCRECGTSNDDASLFCFNCGTRFSDESIVKNDAPQEIQEVTSEKVQEVTSQDEAYEPTFEDFVNSEVVADDEQTGGNADISDMTEVTDTPEAPEFESEPDFGFEAEEEPEVDSAFSTGSEAEPFYDEEPAAPVYEEPAPEPEPYTEPEPEQNFDDAPAFEEPASEPEPEPYVEPEPEQNFDDASAFVAAAAAGSMFGRASESEKIFEDLPVSPQELFGDEYTDIKSIGLGDGTGYKAYSNKYKKQVVIKKIHSQIENLANITDTVNRMKRIKHAALPQVFDYIQAGGNIYSVMEYVEGKSLYRYISEGQHFSEKQLTDWAEQVSKALIYLHTFEPMIIHADIKPSNIIIRPDNTVVLTDYNPETIDKYGAHVIGYSEGYAPPEQYEFRSANTYGSVNYDEKFAKTVTVGADGIYTAQEGTTCEAATRAFSVVDERSDIYNFGASFYFAVTGKKPESSKEDVTPVKKAGGKVSSSFANIINKCMEKDPKNRYQTAAELNSAIRSCKRRPFIIVAAFVLIAILAFVLLVLPKLNKKQKGQMNAPTGVTSMPAPTGDPAVTPTDDPAVTLTEAVTPVVTDTVTDTPAVTDEPTITEAGTPTGEVDPTGEITPTESITPTEEVTPTLVPTPTATPVPTATPSPTPVASPSPTPSGKATPTPTVTPVPTATPAPTATEGPTATPKPTVPLTPTPSLSKVTYYSNLIGFELNDGTLKNYNLGVSTEFNGLKPKEVSHVYFGGYPSVLVTRDSTLKELKKLSYDKKGIAEYGGTKYMKVDYLQSDTQTATLYYRYAPIKWLVLSSSKSELVLISDQVIDFYEYKGLSSWLTSTFSSSAFNSKEKAVISGSISFLATTDASKYTKLNLMTSVTDYANMRKNFGRNRYDSYAVAMWWLNAGNGVAKAPYVDGSGSIMTAGLETDSRQGIRPVITIKIQ